LEFAHASVEATPILSKNTPQQHHKTALDAYACICSGQNMCAWCM
jgi:hypothetical protein